MTLAVILGFVVGCICGAAASAAAISRLRVTDARRRHQSRMLYDRRVTW